jgi:hypothetical protein
VNRQGYEILAGLLRVALVVALASVGLSIYRSLPGGNGKAGGAPEGQSETAVQIVLRTAPGDQDVPLDIPVELYMVDLAAVRREYGSEPRPGMRFEDFLARRMKSHPPVNSRLDRSGQATVMLIPGKWLIHALLAGEQNVEWRLSVEVAGRRQTVELTPENAYARMKTF